jgi:peptidoglycan/xylan/chitin deacetylase (PgdA/CDA1 family)
MFHRVNDYNHKFYPAVPNDAFEKICRFVSKNFNVIYFSDIKDYLKKSGRPAAIISFDDGYYDVMENAYPILQKYRLKFNINIATESIETGLPQDNLKIYDVLNTTKEKEYVNYGIGSDPIKISIDKDFPVRTEMEFVRLFGRLDKTKRRLVADDIVKKLANGSTRFSRILSKEDVCYLHKNGAEIGAHTHTHPILSNCDIPEVEFELAHSKRILEDLCGADIDIIAFPSGRHNELIIQKSYEAGYKYLLLTGDRKNMINDRKDNIFYRIGLYYKTLDENLAKIFGIHNAIRSIKKDKNARQL